MYLVKESKVRNSKKRIYPRAKSIDNAGAKVLALHKSDPT